MTFTFQCLYFLSIEIQPLPVRGPWADCLSCYRRSSTGDATTETTRLLKPQTSLSASLGARVGILLSDPSHLNVVPKALRGLGALDICIARGFPAAGQRKSDKAWQVPGPKAMLIKCKALLSLPLTLLENVALLADAQNLLFLPFRPG